MTLWDPFHVDDASGSAVVADEAGPAHAGASSRRPSRAELESVVETMYQQQCTAKPWQRTADPAPDLSWYEPSCSISNWGHKDVKLKLGQGIAYVTLNKPEAGNLLSGSVLLGLCDAVFALHQRKDIRCVVFSGEGKLLCAGLDPNFDGNFAQQKFPGKVERSFAQLKERAVKAGALRDADANPGPLLQAKLWQSIMALPQFTIALANGSAIGDGLGCVACVDMAIALQNCYFSLSEVREGQVQCLIMPYIVAKVGLGFAKFMAGSGSNVSAEAMQRAGLISEVVQSLEDGHQKIAEICEVLTACGPRSVEAAKQLVMGVGGQPISEAVSFFTAALLAMVTVSDEARDGMICLQTKAPKPWEVMPIKPLQ